MLLQPEALSITESTGLYQSTASQQEQSAVEAQRFEEQSHLHQKHRNVIEALFFGRSAVVDPGAVVNANIVISSFQYRRK